MRLIDADKVKESVIYQWRLLKTMGMGDEDLNLIGDLLKECFFQELANAPTVDAEPVKHGTWKQRKPQWYCSACEKMLYISVKRPSFNYCPFCGAKMDGERREDD